MILHSIKNIITSLSFSLNMDPASQSSLILRNQNRIRLYLPSSLSTSASPSPSRRSSRSQCSLPVVSPKTTSTAAPSPTSSSQSLLTPCKSMPPRKFAHSSAAASPNRGSRGVYPAAARKTLSHWKLSTNIAEVVCSQMSNAERAYLAAHLLPKYGTRRCSKNHIICTHPFLLKRKETITHLKKISHE